MLRTVILYALLMALLVFLLKLLEYKFFVRDLSLEIYVGSVAVVFVLIGIWAGSKVVGKRMIKIVRSDEFVFNTDAMAALEISQRELEVLSEMAQGLSNQDIADKLFISLSTVKTHSANLFAKLDVSRRTQAIRKARDMSLIP